jgi:hypothetical protein
MGNILRNRRIMSSSNVSNTSGGGTDPLDKIRITNLENNEYKITYFTEISAAAGAESPPTGATILLDELQSGADAYVSTLQGGKPSGQMPVTSGGVKVDVATFDALGNYTLTGTPSSYPVALIYTLKIKALNYSNLNLNNVLELEELGLIPAANIVEDSDHNFVTTAEKNKLAALDNRAYSPDANISGSVTLDASVSDVFFRTLTGNVTITVTGLTDGKNCKIWLKQAAGAAYTVTWVGVNWRFATSPVQTTQFGKVDFYSIEMANNTLFGGQDSWR